MPAPSLAYPLINGNRVSWSSVEIKVIGQRYIGVKNVSYGLELKPGDVVGTHIERIARTDGEQKTSGGMEMYKEEADVLIAALAAIGLPQLKGYMQVEFDVIINFRVQSILPISNVVMQNCRITKVDDSHSQGIDALTTKFDLDPMRILRNGLLPIGVPLIPGQF